MAQQKTSFPEFGFVRLPQILACIPVCESAWREGCRTGRYPKPVKLGPRITAWRVEDIKALIERLHEKGIEVKPQTLTKYLTEARRRREGRKARKKDTPPPPSTHVQRRGTRF